MNSDATPPAHAPAALPNDLATCQQMLRELLATVAQLRSQVERQQAQIHYLTCACTSGGVANASKGPRSSTAWPRPSRRRPRPTSRKASPKFLGRRGGGGGVPPTCLASTKYSTSQKRRKPVPVVVTGAVRIGADVSERLNYRPASLFIHAIERPTYVCRHCEREGQNIQAVQAPLPPTPIPRCTLEAGLLAHVIVCKWVDHLPLYRLESILGRLGWDVGGAPRCAIRVSVRSSHVRPFSRSRLDRNRRSRRGVVSAGWR